MIRLNRVCVPLNLDCNLHCKYCYRDKERLDKIPEFSEDMKEYLASLSPDWCEAVIASGGEPLLHFDKVQELFANVPKNVHKKVMTNGTLLTQEIVDYVNENDIELFVSHDGPKSEFLRGIDILKDEKICNLLRQVKTLTVWCVVTKYNTNIWENYFDVVKKLHQVDFMFRANPMNDVVSEMAYFVDGFNYDEWIETYLQFTMSPFNREWPWYHGRTLTKDKPVTCRAVGFNVLPDGTVTGMIRIKSKYGTIKDTLEVCEKNALATGLSNYCDESECKYKDRCDTSLQHIGPHACKCKKMLIDTYENTKKIREIREYVNSHINEIAVKYFNELKEVNLEDKKNDKIRLECVYIKLGSGCNLHCKYCHAEQESFKFNPEILPVLKSLKLKRVTFGGGEPLLYWDTIKKIMSYLGPNVSYRMVSNGTLLTEEMVEWFNRYHLHYAISLDGIHTTRDMSKPIQWDLIKKLRRVGTAVTFYKENSNIRETLASLIEYKKKYMPSMPADIYSSFPNFVHSTAQTGILSNKELADSYISQVVEILEETMQLFKEGKNTGFLDSAYMHFMHERDCNGIRCVNDVFVPMLADGTICACPYTFEKIGDIFHVDEIDWQKIKEKYTIKKCLSCDLFSICGNYCCMNITDDECYIMHQIHDKMKTLMQKYNITVEELRNLYFS